MCSLIFCKCGMPVVLCALFFLTANLVCWPVKGVDCSCSHIPHVEGFHDPVVPLTSHDLPRMNTIEFDVLPDHARGNALQGQVEFFFFCATYRVAYDF